MFYKKIGVNFIGVLLLVSISAAVCLAQEAPSWIDFCAKMKSGDLKNSVLLDYSYAGYHFSEKKIPDLSTWNKISVVDYGAMPNDDIYDDAGIQAAIDAAEASGVPTVVYFPAGKYKVSSEATKDIPIEVNKSHIVLKGTGSDSGGTEIYAVKHGDTTKKWNTPWRFIFKPSSSSSSKITSIKKEINRGDRTIEVADASNIEVGMLLKIDHKGVANLELNMPGLKYNSIWETILERGIRVLEKHFVTKVEGNRVTFKNPVNYNVPMNGDYTNVLKYQPIEEIGVEDILFTSAWKEYPEEYVHHASDIVDYAWRALRFEKVYNSWVRNVKFRDWNDCIQIKEGFAITVKNVEISGKQGHASYMADGSTGVLFENCKDFVPVGFNSAGGQGHGPALQGYSTGCVYSNIQMQNHQSVDCHGYQPYGNLFDNVYGGCFRANGGAEKSYPQSGPDLTFWNVVHASNYSSKEFNFWDTSKRLLHIYAKPKFVGFTSPGENITFKNEGLDELHGTQVYPKSLFNAQLQLRLYDVYSSASSEKNGFEAVNTVDGQADNYWSPDGNAVGSYLMLDFGFEKSVKGISLKEIGNGIKKFKLECWVNNAWVSYEPTIANEEDNTWVIDQIIQTRKIKLVIEEVNDNTQVKVSEFKAFKDSTSSVFGGTKSHVKFDFQVFPNPNKGNFTIELNTPLLGEHSIFTMSGNLIAHGTIQGKQQIELATVPSGIYIVKMVVDGFSTMKNIVIL